jgi:hypothetical protein
MRSAAAFYLERRATADIVVTLEAISANIAAEIQQTRAESLETRLLLDAESRETRQLLEATVARLDRERENAVIMVMGTDGFHYTASSYWQNLEPNVTVTAFIPRNGLACPLVTAFGDEYDFNDKITPLLRDLCSHDVEGVCLLNTEHWPWLTVQKVD